MRKSVANNAILLVAKAYGPFEDCTSNQVKLTHKSIMHTSIQKI